MSINALSQLDPSGEDPKENKEVNREEIEDRIISNSRTNIYELENELDTMRKSIDNMKVYTYNTLMVHTLERHHRKLSESLIKLKNNVEDYIEHHTP